MGRGRDGVGVRGLGGRDRGQGQDQGVRAGRRELSVRLKVTKSRVLFNR